MAEILQAIGRGVPRPWLQRAVNAARVRKTHWLIGRISPVSSASEKSSRAP